MTLRPDVTESIDLVHRAQGGDREALERLIARYYERVRPIVRARVGPRLRTRLDSTDLLQETFVEAVRMFDRFEVRDESSLIRWLSRIAELRVREAVQKMKAAKRDPRREVPIAAGASSASPVVDPADASPSPSENAVDREDAARFEHCLDRLRDEQREVILLRDFSGASWEDVAEAMGKPSAGAARMLHSRALAELASLYGRED